MSTKTTQKPQSSNLVKVSDSVEETTTKRKKPPRAGMGRPKGAINKVQREIKEMILGALDKAGGESYLTMQAHDNPAAFMTLLGKVVPKDVKAEVTGAIELVLANRLKEARERLKSN